MALFKFSLDMLSALAGLLHKFPIVDSLCLRALVVKLGAVGF